MFDETTSVGEGFNTTNSVDTPQGKDKGARRLQCVTPVCIRQLRDCKEEDFKMFGMKCQILCLVGILRDYDVSSTKATYQIEDHTGTVSAIYWLDDSNSTPLPPVKEGRYLRVYGSMRTTDDVKTILVLKMFPIENPNEITTHLLEVIHARLAYENLAKGSGAKIERNNPGADLANSMASFMDDSTSKNENGFNPMQKKVYSILQPITTSCGLSRAEITSRFNQNQFREANEAIEFLISEGHIYSTVDNDHFKATDS